MPAKTGADSARRVLDLLFTFEHNPVASIREIAERAGMPLPTAHRYVAMLREMGLIEEARYGQYRLTMRLVALAQAARRATSIIDTAQPFMQALSEQTDETVLLIQPVAGLPVCTHRVESQRRLRLSFEVGQNLPPLRGASARLLLAALTDHERRNYVEDAIARGGQPPLDGVEHLLTEAEQDAIRGWTTSSEEIDEGIWSVAAALRSEGNFIGTLSLPCPIFRINEENQPHLIEAVRQTAHQISAALGS